MRPPKKKETPAIAVAGGSRGCRSLGSQLKNTLTKSPRKCRRPRLNEAIEALRQMNLECEVAKLEALGKAASLRLIKRKIQALLREVE